MNKATQLTILVGQIEPDLRETPVIYGEAAALVIAALTITANDQTVHELVQVFEQSFERRVATHRKTLKEFANAIKRSEKSTND